MRSLTILLSILLLVPAAGAFAAPQAVSPAQWVAAYWAAFMAKDMAALQALFSPSATVQGRAVQQWIARTAETLSKWSDLAVQPRGEPAVQELLSRGASVGYSVRQTVAITYREGGRPYRVISIYTWTLVRDGEQLRASMLTIGHEAEPGLTVGEVRVATYAAPASPGTQPEEPKSTFRADETICFVVTGEVQGGHNLGLVFTLPNGEITRSGSTYALGPIDAPGPITPLRWTCGRFRNPPPGRWTVAVEVDGHQRGSATFSIAP